MLTDPFATLGVPLTAPYLEVVDRYNSVMQLLALDRYQTEKSQTYAEQNRHLVEQAYQTLSQEDRRAAALETLRQQARQAQPKPNSKFAKALLLYPTIAITAFYESAIDDLKPLQYWSLNNIETVTELLQELNLVFLYIKTGLSDEGGQAVSVPRSPRPSPPSFEAEAEPDAGLAAVP